MLAAEEVLDTEMELARLWLEVLVGMAAAELEMIMYSKEALLELPIQAEEAVLVEEILMKILDGLDIMEALELLSFDT
jgi:hypothetical protein